jgi:hypothetical protein
MLFSTVFLVAFSAMVFAQDGVDVKAETVKVEQIFLAKDNGEGNVGEAVEGFLTTDIPIFCVVQLNSTTPATVKMILRAVDVTGVKAETNVITVSYKTNGRQNRVNFTGRPEGNWTAGRYRIDIFIDDKSAGSQAFEIVRDPLEPGKKAIPVSKPETPKAKPRARPLRTAKKN